MGLGGGGGETLVVEEAATGYGKRWRWWEKEERGAAEPTKAPAIGDLKGGENQKQLRERK